MFASLVCLTHSGGHIRKHTLKFSCKVFADIVTEDARSVSHMLGLSCHSTCQHARRRRRGKRMRVERSGVHWTERCGVHGVGEGGSEDRKEQRQWGAERVVVGGRGRSMKCVRGRRVEEECWWRWWQGRAQSSEQRPLCGRQQQLCGDRLLLCVCLKTKTASHKNTGWALLAVAERSRLGRSLISSFLVSAGRITRRPMKIRFQMIFPLSCRLGFRSPRRNTRALVRDDHQN